jgi:hypothetical protein
MQDFDSLRAAMEAVGFRLVSVESGTMDSGSAEFSDGKRSIKIGKDRSIWQFIGSRKQLEPLGLWQGYGDTSAFRDVLLEYVRRLKA